MRTFVTKYSTSMIAFCRKIFMSLGILLWLSSCNNHPSSSAQNVQADNGQAASTKDLTDFHYFDQKFALHSLPFSIPSDANDSSGGELDKKYIKEFLSSDFTPAFGKDDILPVMTDNMDGAKYYADGKVKLDSFTAYIIHKQGDDDYYFLCLFNKDGQFTDGTWIAFTEGTDDDGTVREASINDDGSIEISQYDVLKGKEDQAGAQRHFYEITSKGKIRDLKENAKPEHA